MARGSHVLGSSEKSRPPTYEITPDYVNLLTAPTEQFLCELKLGFFTKIMGHETRSWRHQTMEMYDNFDGFPSKWCIVWVGNVMTPGFVGDDGGFFHIFSKGLGFMVPSNYFLNGGRRMGLTHQNG